MDMHRLSACTYPFRDRPWAEALEKIRRAGFTRVDLLGRAPHFSADAESDLEALWAFAQSLGLEIANLGTYVGRGFAGDAAAQRAEWEALCRVVDIAARWGVRSIRVVPGNDDPACLPQIVPWFRKAAAYAQARGIYLGFETHGGGISGSLSHMRALVEGVASPHFGILYDPCNVMKGGVDYRAALWALRGHIAHVHLKDGAFGQEGFRLTMLGQGQIDVPWLAEMLDAWGYRGDLALEYELDAPPPEEGLAQWYAFAERLWGKEGA
ncbi:MAG: sugar phosphate isomerase/epimerase [Chloroflexi bacterium]|nr:sugar phosphate isomerase/epimerase [Chloroflexota bacterium]